MKLFKRNILFSKRKGAFYSYKFDEGYIINRDTLKEGDETQSMLLDFMNSFKIPFFIFSRFRQNKQLELQRVQKILGHPKPFRYENLFVPNEFLFLFKKVLFKTS
jgi:hypothetical protein